jgi:hypothetical protein
VLFAVIFRFFRPGPPPGNRVRPESFAFGATTTTTLTLSSATVTSGTMITLSAAVTTGLSTTVSLGLVTFCDATAAHCLNSAILGTAQLTSAGTAVLRLIPGIGTHQYTAVFNGTNSYSSSSSTAQSLSVTGTYTTGTTLTSTGTAGNYTLAATVVGNGGFTQSPTAALSFVDTSNSNFVFGTAQGRDSAGKRTCAEDGAAIEEGDELVVGGIAA